MAGQLLCHSSPAAGRRWVPVKVVSERLRHANATITLTVYQHFHLGMGRQAADRFAVLPGG